MDVGINNIIYMELHSGPKMANGTCGKTIAGMIDRGSTVLGDKNCQSAKLSTTHLTPTVLVSNLGHIHYLGSSD